MALFRASRPAKTRYGGEVIHSERDPFGLIQIIDSKICRSLHFDTAVKQSRYFFQAPLTLAFEYQQVMEQKLNDFSFQYPLKRILMLGVGGGSLASKLFISQPKLEMTLIELRQSVIEIAHDFFHLPIHSRIRTVCQDAVEFVMDAEIWESYDAIVLDAFDSEGIPEALTQPVFLEKLLKLKQPNGLLLVNLWQSTPEPTLKVIQTLEKHAQIELTPINSSKNLVCCAR
jgi:spermidine synthase